MCILQYPLLTFYSFVIVLIGTCLGAIPRNSQYTQYQKIQPKPQPIHQQQQPSHHASSPQFKKQPLYINKRTANYTPKSASYSIFCSDMQSRLPPIKEFRSPTKASISSPARVASAPRLRYLRNSTIFQIISFRINNHIEFVVFVKIIQTF